MGRPAGPRCLQRQIGPGRTRIERMAVRGHRGGTARRLHGSLGNHKHQCSRALRPGLVERVQQAQQRVPALAVAAGIDKAPRLRVVRRRCPTGCLEQCFQFHLGNFGFCKAPRGPAIEEDRVDRPVSLAGIACRHVGSAFGNGNDNRNAATRAKKTAGTATCCPDTC